MDPIAQIKARQVTLLDERAAAHTAQDEILTRCTTENREPNDTEAAEFRAAADKKTAVDTELDTLRSRLAGLEDEARRDAAAAELRKSLGDTGEHRSPGRVLREERTYTPEKSARGEASFVIDAYAAQQGNQQARARIERNLQEAMVEGEISKRATTTASFAGLVVPQYLVDKAALVARAGRPFANTVTNLPLPEQGMSFIIPRGTTGAAESVQATENSSVQSTDEVWANVTVPVITIAGQQDVSRQSIERGTPGIDELIYMDLAGAYAVALDQQVISGTGSSGQALGVVNTAGISQATAFTAAATTATFYTKLAGAINAIETLRFRAPNLIAMHPRRWNWLLTQVDTSGRPLVVPNSGGPFNALANSGSPLDTPSQAPVGTILGLPVITDASIPTAVGTGPEDQVIVYCKDDLLLWEVGDGMPRELRFEQTLGNQLTVKIVAYNYAAFTAGRYPTSVALVGGNAGTAGFGLAAPTF